MQIIIKQAEGKLIKALDDIQQATETWLAVRFFCSKLNTEHCQPQHLQIALNVISEALSGEVAMAYYCFDRDIIILCKRASIQQLHKIEDEVKFLFVDDPFVTSPDSVFSQLSDLRNDYDKFYFACKQKQSEAAQYYKTLDAKTPPKSEIKTDIEAVNLDNSLLQQTISERKTRIKLKILVVEDHDFSRKLVVKALGRDFDSIAADNGANALKIYAAHAPNIVFLDIGLPVINGHDVLKKIIAVDKDAYVIMLSANTSADDVKGAILEGAKGFIAKPFTKQKMLNYIQKYTSEHQ